jgi:hypothetical protein
MIVTSVKALYLLSDHFTFKEVKEERPVGTGLMATVVLSVGKATIHQSIVHTREEVSAHSFIAEQFING